jgi:hypothetical protein
LYIIKKMANNNYKIAENILVSDIIAAGSTTTPSYTGFPPYKTANLSFQRHNENFGYKVSNTDLANTVEAFYREYIGGGSTNTGSAQGDSQINNASKYAYYNYGNTITASDTIPSWCTKVRVIVIGAGGGGGGGGTNSQNHAGSGGGGGSGGLAAGTISVTSGQTYTISLGGCGRGGFYQGSSNSNGRDAVDPVSTVTSFIVGTSIIQANCGGAGKGGPKGDATNEQSGTAAGGDGSVNSTNNLSDAHDIKKTGSGGNAGNDNNPGESAGIQNSVNLPVLNTNQGDAPNNSSNPAAINQDNQLPGIGQGGWGGVNHNNGNGYGGQCGGRSLVRVYFIR